MPKTAKTPKKQKTVKKVTDAHIKDVAKEAIKSMAEKKESNIQNNVDPVSNPVNNVDFPVNNIRMLSHYGTSGHVIPQGTGQGERVGNKIRIVEAPLELCFFPTPFDVTSNSQPCPQNFRVLIVKIKGPDKSLAALDAICDTSIFQFGDLDYGLVGDITDMLGVINKDLLTVYYDKEFKVGAQIYNFPAAVPGGTAYFHSNNDYPLNKRISIDLMKHGMPVVWDYNDASTLPYENPLWLIVIPVNGDGTANASTTNADPLQWVVNRTVKYIDI